MPYINSESPLSLRQLSATLYLVDLVGVHIRLSPLVLKRVLAR